MIDGDFPDVACKKGSAQDLAFEALPAGTPLWLLQAIFNDSGASPKGLEKFLASLGEDEIDGAVYQLLPLFADHLEATVSNDPLKKRLKGIQRLTWYKNQLQLGNLARLLGEFRDADISTLLLGDAASESLLYEKRFIRPVQELTLLIDFRLSSAGSDLLQSNGWKPKFDFPGVNRMFIPGQRFVKGPEKNELELRWHVLSTCCYANADLDFWRLAQPLSFEGVATLTLNATDLLLYLAAQVFNSERSRTVLWIADALKILQNTHVETDWDRLLVQARRQGVVVPLRTLLNFLSRHFEINVPAPVLSKLNQKSFSRVERLEARYRRYGPDQRLLGDFPLLYFAYRRYSGNYQGNGRAPGFGAFLKAWWQVNSNHELLQLMVLLSKRRITSRLRKTRIAISEKEGIDDL